MKKLLFSLLLFIATIISPSFAQLEVLKTKLGSDSKGIKLEGSGPDYSFLIEAPKGPIKSVKIEFHRPTQHETYLKKDQKGFCLVMPSGGDVVFDRLFFFNTSAKLRYEVNPNLKVKSILLQDFPDAHHHRPCVFSDLLKLQHSGKKVRIQ